MATHPPSVELAYQQLTQGLAAVGLGAVDLMKASWPDIEKGVARLLRGPFDPRKPEHQAVALGVAAAFGKRLSNEHGAFYAQNRESADGFVLGFPEAILMFSPLAAVIDALARANLAQLEEVAKEIRTTIGRAKLSLGAGAPMRLTAQDYERLFDPAFAQFVLLEDAKLKEAFDTPAGALSRNLRDGLERATQLPQDVKKALDSQLGGALSALDPSKPISGQMDRAGRISELVATLFSATEATRPAPDEFWAAVVFPLLFIGDPASFPPLDEEDREAVRSGMDPLFLYLDLVPYAFTAPDPGILGAFDGDQATVPHPAMQGLSPLRLIALDGSSIAEPLSKFDAAKARASFERFCQHVAKETGQTVQPGPSAQVIDEAAALVSDFRRVFAARDKGKVSLRRLTEAEAAGESALAILRKSLQGPRIILA